MKPLSELCSEHLKKSAAEMPSEEGRTAPGNGVNTTPSTEVIYTPILDLKLKQI